MKFSLPVVVFLIFLVLKLTEYGPVANWSWWWVTSPLWILAVLIVVIFGGFLAIVKYWK